MTVAPDAQAERWGRTYQLAEQRLGRRLTPGEQAMDLVGVDRDLELGKQMLWLAVDKEKRRVIEGLLRGLATRMQVTPEMRAAILWLHAKGVEHAHGEMRRRGVRPKPPVILYAARRRRFPLSLRVRFEDSLQAKVGAMQSKIESEVVGAEVGDLGFNAIVQALDRRILGAGSIAAALTSGPFDAGRSEAFEANEDLFQSWVYSAVMDGGTCDVCADADGTEYQTLDEAFEDLPDFGPNPECLGADRCRCTLVPGDPVEPQELPAGEEILVPEDQPADLPPGHPKKTLDAALLNGDFLPKEQSIWRHVPDVSQIIPSAKKAEDLVGKAVTVRTHLTGKLKRPPIKPLKKKEAILRIDVEKGSYAGRVEDDLVLPPHQRLEFTQFDPLCARFFERAREYAKEPNACPIVTKSSAQHPDRPFIHLADSSLQNMTKTVRRNLARLEQIPAAELTEAQTKQLADIRLKLPYLEREIEVRGGPPAPTPAVAAPTPALPAVPLPAPPTTAEAKALQARRRKALEKLPTRELWKLVPPDVELPANSPRGRLIRTIIERGQEPLPPRAPVRPPGRVIRPPQLPVAPLRAQVEKLTKAQLWRRLPKEVRQELGSVEKSTKSRLVDEVVKAKAPTPEPFELPTAPPLTEEQAAARQRLPPLILPEPAPVPGPPNFEQLLKRPIAPGRRTKETVAARNTFGVLGKVFDGSFFARPDRKVSFTFRPQKPTTRGSFVHDASQINLNPEANAWKRGAAREQTLLHEFAHFLDFKHLGASIRESGVLRAMRLSAIESDPDIRLLMRRIRESKAFKKLDAAKTQPASVIDQSHRLYLMKDDELFARSFAQFVTTRLEQLNAAGQLTQNEQLMLARMLEQQTARARDAYGTMWTKDDFKPVYAAFVRLAKAKGWMR